MKLEVGGQASQLAERPRARVLRGDHSLAPAPASRMSRATRAAVERITANILVAFAQPHAGALHPSKPDVSRFWLPARVTTGAA